MFKLLIDTCVWLDLAKDAKSGPLLDVLDRLIERSDVSLIVPRITIDEFARNKPRVVKEVTQSISSALKRVREAVWQFDDPRKRRRLAARLTDLDVKLPTLGDTAAAAVARIERLMTQGEIVDASDRAKTRAAERALVSSAPFHRNKNSMADAVLIEIYAEAVASRVTPGVRFAFVTHNKNDFSVPNGDHRKPHPDLAALFSRIKSLYCVTLADALRRVDARLLSDEMLVAELDFEPRSGSEIGDAIGEFTDKIWYGRHKLREQMIEDGKITLVDKHSSELPFPNDEIQRDIWAGALKSARKVEKRYGLPSLGPWDDFEWGMINGKLSALRWVMGKDWDELYT